MEKVLVNVRDVIHVKSLSRTYLLQKRDKIDQSSETVIPEFIIILISTQTSLLFGYLHSTLYLIYCVEFHFNFIEHFWFRDVLSETSTAEA
jgi:hypothetical protein